MPDWNLLHDLPASARAGLRKRTQPKWLSPMLATLTDRPFSREGWLFEPKMDGERCLVFRDGEDIRLFSRNHKSLNLKYPELTEAFRNQKTAAFIADGEIVTFERDVTSFAKLQPRMQVQRPGAELRREVPVWFYAFDLLYFASYDTRQVPLRYRKELLVRAFQFNDPLRLTKFCETEGKRYYQKACNKRWEGVIAKNGDSIYVSQRSRNWLKFKCVKEQEFVIGGFTEPKGHRIALGALLVGYYEAGTLIYAGKVGTGYDNTTLSYLGEQLSRLETSVCPFVGDAMPHHSVHWVKPRLVAEIGFTEWTAGGKLRHPRFLGLRTDKKPRDVVREK
jgi:DNA ligase D-like protein (predicted ligase)